MRYLLDVNVLLAMRYEAHMHHLRVACWLSDKRFIYSDSLCLVTSPITELGFVRIASGPAGFARDVDAAQDDLERLVVCHGLMFVEDRLRAYPLPAWVRKSAQATDGHLLQLAASHGLTFVTLDQGIRGAEVISELADSAVREAGVLADTHSRGGGLWMD